MLFYLGTHEDQWLWTTQTRDRVPIPAVPLFISARRLRKRRRFGQARSRWALDSGGFSELSLFARWETSPQQYADEVRRWSECIGRMDWAAIQDWMCEPVMLARTGLTIAEHQARTIESWHTLNRLAPDVPWTPVVQGWRLDDYLGHVEQYREAGVDLAALPVVGVGSVCRRQAMGEAEEIVRALAGLGLRVHGFGFKLQGLARCADALHSADSLAWSLAARRENGPLPGCRHRKCASCIRYAMRWREQVLAVVARPKQGWLF